MKITITPSQDQSNEEHPYYAVTLESPTDDITIAQGVEMLVKALQAWGFDPEVIKVAMEGFEP